MSLLSKLFFKIENLPERFWWLISLSLIVLYYLPYFIVGEDSHFRIHDNLDSNVLWAKLVMDSGTSFSLPDQVLEVPLGGLQRFQVYILYDFPLLIFNLFGIYWGYIINKFIISLIAFFGLKILLENHIATVRRAKPVLFLICVAFSLIPFWSFTASIMGLPLLLFVFLQLRQNKTKWWVWLVIIFYGFHSHLVLVGFFFLFLMSVLWVYDIFLQRKVNFSFFSGLLLLTVILVVSHIGLFYGLIFAEPSHRSSFILPEYSLKKSLELVRLQFFYGRFHAFTFHFFLLPPTLLLFIGLYKKLNAKIKLALLYVVLCPLFVGFLYSPVFKEGVNLLWQVLPMRLERFWFLDPLFWYILIGGVLIVAYDKLNIIFKICTVGLCLFQIAYLFYMSENRVYSYDLSFREYYSTNTVTKLREVLEKDNPNYRIGCLGIEPAILQFSQVKTIDGYFPSYSNKYKSKFSNSIRKEIQKAPFLQTKFESDGARCYLFSAQLGLPPYQFKKAEVPVVSQWDINIDALKSLKTTHIVSSVEINHEQLEQLETIKHAPMEYWDLFVYEIQ